MSSIVAEDGSSYDKSSTTNITDRHEHIITYIESIVNAIPFLEDFLKIGTRVYGGFIRTIISSLHTPSHITSEVNENGIFNITKIPYLQNGDIDLSYIRESPFFERNKSSLEEIFIHSASVLKLSNFV